MPASQPNVVVQVRANEHIEKTLRRFRRECQRAKIRSRVRRRARYEKPSDQRRRRERKQAQQKRRSERRTQQRQARRHRKLRQHEQVLAQAAVQPRVEMEDALELRQAG